MLHDQRLGQTLGQGVSVRPTQFLRAPRARFGQICFQPADAVLANLILQRSALQIFRRVLLGPRLHAQARGDLVALGALLRLFDQFLQRPPLLLGVETSDPARSVIRSQLLGDATILLPGHVAGGKMQQPGMIRRANEFENVDRGIGIGGESVAQVGIKICQAGTIDNEVEILLQTAAPSRHSSPDRTG